MHFLVSQKGRQLQIIVGSLLIVIAMASWGELLQLYEMIIGLAMVAGALFDFYLIAAFFNLPMGGKKIRRS